MAPCQAAPLSAAAFHWQARASVPVRPLGTGLGLVTNQKPRSPPEPTSTSLTRPHMSPLHFPPQCGLRLSSESGARRRNDRANCPSRSRSAIAFCRQPSTIERCQETPPGSRYFGYPRGLPRHVPNKGTRTRRRAPENSVVQKFMTSSTAARTERRDIADRIPGPSPTKGRAR